MPSRMDFSFAGPDYLSFKTPFSWRGIPPFAVLVGRNGSGKSQLLSLLHQAATQTANKPRASLTGLSAKDDEVVYRPVNWSLPNSRPASLESLSQARERVLRGVISGSPEGRRVRERAGLPSSGQVDRDIAYDAIREDDLFGVTPDPMKLVEQLGSAWQDYWVTLVQKRITGGPAVEETPPWELANQLLAASAVPYLFTTPEGSDIRKTFSLQLVDKEVPDRKVVPSQLSSGESVLVSLILSIFAGEQYGRVAKLVVLDEPDAHLHTSQVDDLLRMLRDKFVGQFGGRVIMSTHRPDTISLLRAEEMFEVVRTGTARISPCTPNAKARVLSGMTASALEILPSIRVVFVEDQTDVEFYNAVRTALELEEHVPPTPTLVFERASIGAGNTKIAGGCNVVREQVAKLRRPGVSVVRGLIDRDGGSPTVSDGVTILGRYSIENYLSDPLVVAAALLDADLLPADCAAGLTCGQSPEIARLSQEKLTEVAGGVSSLILRQFPSPPPGDAAMTTVSLANGSTYQIPQTFIEVPGKQILQRINELGLALGDTRAVKRDRLQIVMRNNRLVSSDLAEMFRKLQGS